YLQGWGLIVSHCARPTRALLSLHHYFRGVAKAALDCAHRTSTVSSCAFCEQGGHLATPPPLRPRVARAQEIISLHPALCSASRRTVRLPHPFLSSPLENFSVVFRVHSRLVGKTQRGTVGITCIVEIDAIMPTDGFHGCFECNGLRIEVARCMRAAGEYANHVGLRELEI